MTNLVRAEQARRELSYRRCFPDWEDSTPEELLEAFIYFCVTYAYIRHPRGKRLFPIRPAQQITAESLVRRENIIVLKARQIGFSTLFSVYALWVALGYPDRQIIVLSRNEREAVKLLGHAKYAYRFLPDWFKDRAPRKIDDHQGRMTFDNESQIESLPSRKDAARGSTAWLLIADEFAFLEDQDEAWSAMEPATDVGGQIVVLSTANGAGDLYEELWNRAYTGNGGVMTPIFFPWHANSDRDQEWYDRKKRSYQEWQLHQEYPETPEEAFVRSGRGVFDYDRLNAMEPIEGLRGFLLGDSFHPHTEGELTIWEFPQDVTPYVIGADVALGELEGADYSCAYVLRADTGDVVAEYHAHIDVDLYGEDVLYNLGRFYNEALIAPEANGSGLSALKALLRAGYFNIYKRRRMGKRRDEESEVLGWLTTAQTKPLAIDELNAWLRNHSVPSAYAIRELKTFVRDEKGKLHGSPHDDRVMALAIAVQMVKYAFDPQYRQKKIVIPKDSIAYFDKMGDTQPRKRGLGRLHMRRT